MKTIKEILLRILKDARGDDFERAEISFKNLTEAELDEQFATSGHTRREILTGYLQEREEWLKAYNFVQSMED